MKCYTVDVPHCGELKVYVQGERKPGKIGFLTVHDVGHNHKYFQQFVEAECMRQVAQRSVWINVCLPGQDDDAENLAENFSFPTPDQISDDLLNLLDKHSVQSVVGFGHGAGAGILYRFGLKYPNRCLGLILIHCDNRVSQKDVQPLNMKFLTVKESCGKLFNKIRYASMKPQTQTARNSTTLNMHNVILYWKSYNKRTEISQLIKANKMVSVLLIAGQFSKHIQSSRTINALNLNEQLLVILEAADPLVETPEELAKALILFCKGCGIMVDVPMVGLEKEYKQIKDHRPPTSAQLEVCKKYQRYENLLPNKDL